MSHSLRPYFLLLQASKEIRTVTRLRLELGDAGFEALHRSGWLHLVPPQEARLAIGEPARDLRVSAGSDLAEDQSGTLVCGATANERALLEAACSWLSLRAFVPDNANIGRELVLVGWVEWPESRPVLFVRRVDFESVVQFDELEKRGPALVLAATSDSALPQFIVDRYTGPSPVRLLFLEDFAVVRGGRAVFADLPRDLHVRRALDGASDDCDLVTMDGRCRISRDEVHDVRARRGEYDLFVDFSAPAAGAVGHYAGSARHGDTLWSFTLTNVEAAILREFVNTPRTVISVDELRCKRALQIRSPLKKFSDMRRKVDVAYARNSYRAFHGQKNEFGRTESFEFCPPQGFRLAVLERSSR